MIIVSADVPLQYVPVNDLENIVRSDWTLEISKVQSSYMADDKPVMEYESLKLRLTTMQGEFGLRIEQMIPVVDIMRCKFDIVTDTVKELVRVLRMHQKEAWEHYRTQRGRV